MYLSGKNVQQTNSSLLPRVEVEYRLFGARQVAGGGAAREVGAGAGGVEARRRRRIEV
jgi:hypothetical protein